MMICNTCGLDKIDTQFPKNGKDANGATRRRPDCNVCYTIKRKIKKSKHNKFVNNTKHRTGEDGTYSLQDWKEALLHFKGCCAYCGKEQSRRYKLTREHIEPVHGLNVTGKTTKLNIIPACKSCNSSKANSPLEVWYPKQKFYSSLRQEIINQWRRIT